MDIFIVTTTVISILTIIQTNPPTITTTKIAILSCKHISQ